MGLIINPYMFGIGGNDANTLLLLHADGTDASTSFPDASTFARTVTAIGQAQVDTAQSKFGGASALFDGSGDYLSVPDSADWVFGSGDFTVDCQARFNSLASPRGIFGQSTDGNNLIRLYAQADGGLAFQLWVGGSAVVVMTSAAGTVTTGTWYHIALVRNGNSWNIYKDGVSVANVTDADSVANFTGAFCVGYDMTASNMYFNGWIDEFRVSNIARWTTTFPPPSQAYG